MRTVLRPEVLSWKRPEARPERRPWLMEDEDPEQLARESIAGLQEALDDLHAILELR
ncbi:MAG TPA: hypothetical protein VHC97_10730 [Thermoanaerobaculia bacterium]|nr:hypothetical protein [Thermoanaerobaculia bacterium]